MNKILCALMLSVAAMSAQAENTPQAQPRPGGAGDAEQFAKMKAKVVEIKQNHLNGVQASLQCIQAAQNRDALRTCHEQDRKAHEEMRAKMESMKDGAGHSPGGDRR